jgi:hypothetical protein
VNIRTDIKNPFERDHQKDYLGCFRSPSLVDEKRAVKRPRDMREACRVLSFKK